MILNSSKAVALIVTMVLIAGACSGSTSSEPDRPLIIATTSIWGDLVTRMVGENATVEVLIPRGADPHDFQPSSRQVARMRDASLIVANGYGLEVGLIDVLETAAGDGVSIVYLGDSVEPLLLTESSLPDPHFWMDPRLVGEALDGLADSLARSVDLPASTWADAAADLRAELAGLDATLSSDAEAIPLEHRKLVTTHDSLGYFAAAYGFEVVGVAVAGGSTLATPSTADLSRLIDDIKAEGVPAVFVDSGQFTELAMSIADSAGVVVVPINVASLGELGTPSESYVGMMREFGEAVREALA